MAATTHPKTFLYLYQPIHQKKAVNQILKPLTNCDLKILIRGNAEEFSFNRSSDIDVLYDFFYNAAFANTNFRRLQNLHMKAYLVDDASLLITSGNMTNSGMFASGNHYNIEGGIATDDEIIIRQFKDYFQRLWSQAEPLDLFLPHIEEMYLAYIASLHKKLTPTERKKHVYRLKPTQKSPRQKVSPPPPFISFQLK